MADWEPPSAAVLELARVLMGGGEPCEGAIDDAEKVLRYLRRNPFWLEVIRG